MLNAVFVVLVIASVVVAAWTGGLEALNVALLDSAKSAVKLALDLVGVMALFLGVMKVAEDGGLLRMLARAVGPVLRRLFPQIPADHPAMSSMLLNISCNMAGLGNAATPFGLKAMADLDRLNRVKGTATDAMVLFLAINTSGLSLLPTGTIALRAAAGSAEPGWILLPTLIATTCSTTVGIVAATLLARLPRYRRDASDADPSALAHETASSEPEIDRLEAESLARRGPRPRLAVPVAAAVALALAAALVVDLVRHGGGGALASVQRLATLWLLPLLVGGLVLFGWYRGVKVYESLIEGAKEGFQLAVRIIPYLVAILVAVGLFRASGAMGALISAIDPLTSLVGVPGEVLPMALVRPLSGTGAMGVMAEILNNPALGPDSLVGRMVSTIQGSTETTFYVLAVYCGSIGVRRTRHAVPACLAADAAGIAAAVAIVRVLAG